jgi:hypothetical protein
MFGLLLRRSPSLLKYFAASGVNHMEIASAAAAASAIADDVAKAGSGS